MLIGLLFALVWVCQFITFKAGGIKTTTSLTKFALFSINVTIFKCKRKITSLEFHQSDMTLSILLLRPASTGILYHVVWVWSQKDNNVSISHLHSGAGCSKIYCFLQSILVRASILQLFIYPTIMLHFQVCRDCKTIKLKWWWWVLGNTGCNHGSVSA